MSAIAIFTCRQNSHPFQERHVSVHESVKIGRSVARARPAPNNAIFDCKVLSRNHALLWYEDGSFFLQDTKSSNGTFVNNQRLSKGSEESPPREIFSGDIIQFGVDVMENSRRVTHSCIIGSIQLYHPDGREATNQHSSPFLNNSGASVGAQSQELYQIAQYLQEALHREQMLENKLATLQRLVSTTQEASESGWQALIDEDRLLSRLEVLENQLAAYSKNQTEDTLRQELTHLQEDKYNYETTAKESLRKVLQEKVDAVRKLSDLERSLSNTEDECAHLRDMCETSQTELRELAERHEEKLADLSALQDKLSDTEQKAADDADAAEAERAELAERVEQLQDAEQSLQARVEQLQAANDFTKEQLTNMKARMEALKENNGEIPRICDTESQGVQVDLVNFMDLKLLQSAESDDDNDSDVTTTDDDNDGGDDAAGLREEEAKVKDILDCLDASLEEKVSLDTLRHEHGDGHKDRDMEQSTETLREKLKDSQEKIEEYKSQLEASSLKVKENQNLVEKLQGELEAAKAEMSSRADKISVLEDKLKTSDDSMSNMVENVVADLKQQLSEARKQASLSTSMATTLKAQITEMEGDLKKCGDTSSPAPGSHGNGVVSDSRGEITSLKGLLAEAKQACTRCELEVNRVKGELSTSQQSVSRLTTEAATMRRQLEEAHSTARQKLLLATTLQDQLQTMEKSSKDVRQQILSLKDELGQSQLDSKQAQSEAEKLRLQLSSVQEELEYVQSLTTDTTPPGDNQDVHASQTKREFSSLKQECLGLRARVQAVEAEMGVSRTEHHQLQTDHRRLQEAYHSLEQLKVRLEDRQQAWSNLTDAEKQGDVRQAGHGKQAPPDEASLRAQCSTYRGEISRLEGALSALCDDYDFLAYRTRTLSACSMLPIMMLILAVVIAFYPLLATITATTQPDSGHL